MDLHRSAHLMTMLSLVAAGLGVALVPASMVSLNIGGKVVYRPLTGVTESMELRVVYRRQERAPAVRIFPAPASTSGGIRLLMGLL